MNPHALRLTLYQTLAFLPLALLHCNVVFLVTPVDAEDQLLQRL